MKNKNWIGLRGLVPPRRLKMHELYQAEPDPLRKNIFLSDLHNRNETLFFRLLIDHMEEMGK
jgi:malate dehydrogenase (oxaloacetate-decarboxylating)